MILNDLFKKQKNSLVKAKIVAKESSTKCVVIDSKGHKFTVESDGSFAIGSYVQIQNNIIINRVKSKSDSMHFIV